MIKIFPVFFLVLVLSSCSSSRGSSEEIEVVTSLPNVLSLPDFASKLEEGPPFQVASDVAQISPITGVATDTFVACRSDRVRVGGGCKCGVDGNITRHLASSGNKWVCSCDRYEPDLGGLAFAYCAKDQSTSLRQVSTPIDEGHQEYSATCAAGEVAISAGISCGDEGTGTPTSLYPVSAQAWKGECDNVISNPKILVYCTTTGAKAVKGKTISVVSSNFTGNSGSVTCGSSEKMISGGCKCPTSHEMDNSFTSDMNTWNCFCQLGAEDSGGTAYAMCAQG